jgi:hypothetical protein
MEKIDWFAIERQKDELDREIQRCEINRDVNFEQGWYEEALNYDKELRRLRQQRLDIDYLVCNY